MPIDGYSYPIRVKTWANMRRWERKEFYRMNESRKRRGKPPLPKP